MAKRRTEAPPQRLILDAGAVIALSLSDVRGRAALAAAIEAGAEVSIPSVVVVENVRGAATDAPVNRVIKAVGQVDVVDESVGRTAGRLLSDAASNETVDAIVVATAIEVGGAIVLTGDPSDLEALASGYGQAVIQVL